MVTWKCDQDVLLLNNRLVLERGELREHVPGNSNVTITMHTLLHQIKKSSVAILNCDNHIKLRANYRGNNPINTDSNDIGQVSAQLISLFIKKSVSSLFTAFPHWTNDG